VVQVVGHTAKNLGFLTGPILELHQKPSTTISYKTAFSHQRRLINDISLHYELYFKKYSVSQKSALPKCLNFFKNTKLYLIII